MGLFSKGGAPKPPDPAKTAAAEAKANRIDTYSPSGSGIRYGRTNSAGEFVPTSGQAAQQYVESDVERQIREALEPASVDLTRRIIDDNITNMPGAPRVQDRSDVARDMFDRSFSLMAPAIDKANERLLVNLQARGLPVGSEAFNEAYGEQVQQTQDTLARLAMDSNLAAGQEQSRTFSLDQAQRQGSMAELIAAMGGSYAPPNPVPSGQAAGINYSGLAANNYAAEAQAHANRQASATEGAATLGTLGAALIKSSSAFKDVLGAADLAAIARIVADMPIAVWTYKKDHAPIGDHGGAHVGPMAEVFQQATTLGRPTHIDAVDYMGILMAALQNALHRIESLERAFDVATAQVLIEDGAPVH